MAWVICETWKITALYATKRSCLLATHRVSKANAAVGLYGAQYGQNH
jgi:hypothetical protein